MGGKQARMTAMRIRWELILKSAAERRSRCIKPEHNHPSVKCCSEYSSDYFLGPAVVRACHRANEVQVTYCSADSLDFCMEILWRFYVF